MWWEGILNNPKMIYYLTDLSTMVVTDGSTQLPDRLVTCYTEEFSVPMQLASFAQGLWHLDHGSVEVKCAKCHSLDVHLHLRKLIRSWCITWPLRELMMLHFFSISLSLRVTLIMVSSDLSLQFIYVYSIQFWGLCYSKLLLQVLMAMHWSLPICMDHVIHLVTAGRRLFSTSTSW